MGPGPGLEPDAGDGVAADVGPGLEGLRDVADLQAKVGALPEILHDGLVLGLGLSGNAHCEHGNRRDCRGGHAPMRACHTFRSWWSCSSCSWRAGSFATPSPPSTAPNGQAGACPSPASSHSVDAISVMSLIARRAGAVRQCLRTRSIEARRVGCVRRDGHAGGRRNPAGAREQRADRPGGQIERVREVLRGAGHGSFPLAIASQSQDRGRPDSRQRLNARKVSNTQNVRAPSPGRGSAK